MADVMEGGQAAGEQGAAPLETSQAGGSELSSAQVIAALVDKVTRLEKQVRSQQSGKDRGVTRLEKQIDELSKALETAKARQASGEDEDEPASQPRVQEQADNLVDVDEELLGLLGVSPNDPQFVMALLKGEDPLAAAKAIASKKKNQPSGTGAGVMPVTGGGTASTSQASLKAAYEQRLGQIRQGDINGLAALKSEFRKKGLEVW